MVEMIPKINGEERREEGRFVLPEGEVRVFGAVAYVTVLEDRLAKIGLRRKWNYVEWKERETAAVCFNMLPKEKPEADFAKVEALLDAAGRRRGVRLRNLYGRARLRVSRNPD